MAKLAILSIALLFTLAAPASAQHVIENPGWCAQFYPNANCQNKGPNNPCSNGAPARFQRPALIHLQSPFA